MKHGNGYWTSAIGVVATAAMLGCGTSNSSNPAAPVGGAGVSPILGASGVGGAVTTPPKTGSGGATGATPPPTTGSGGVTAGTSGQAPIGPVAGASGSMAGSNGGSVAGNGGSGAAGSAGTMAGMGSCGPETTISATDLGDPMKRGPWTPAMKAGAGPSGQSTLFYPMDLGKGGVMHPVFHWGCGAGSTPDQYADHLNLLASHGFVVIANASGSMPAKPSLDWMLAENDKMGSEFFGKLDKNRVGIGGHSLGALETFQAADDPRIKLYVLVCGGSGSGTTGAANIHAPSIFLGGEGESGTMNFVADYGAIPMPQSSIFITKTNTDHIYCARNNLGPWVAFMRMNFCGEDKWKAEFKPDGTYCKSPWLACMTKGL